MRLVTTSLLLVVLLGAQDKIGAGTYKGSWEGAGGSGDFHLMVGGDNQVEIGFTVGGQEVPCKVTSVKLDGASIESVCEFNLQGGTLQLTIKGTLKSKSLDGTFSLAGSDVGGQGGTWKTTLQ